MRCPFLEVIPGVNQYMYTITTDASLNITGKCDNDKELLLECGSNSVWRQNSTCKKSGSKTHIGGRRTEGEKTVKTHSSYILLYGTLKCA